MRLQRLCDVGSGRILALTDVGAFVMPNVRGGWAQRRAVHQITGGTCGHIADPRALAAHLGMGSAPLAGCGCVHKR